MLVFLSAISGNYSTLEMIMNMGNVALLFCPVPVYSIVSLVCLKLTIEQRGCLKMVSRNKQAKPLE